MKTRNIIFLALIFFLLSSCAAKKFIIPTFDQRTHDHRIIAVIPFEMVYTGNMPKNLTAADMEKISDVESKAFQTSLANALLHKSGTGRKDIKIEIQATNKTLNTLESNGISISQAAKMTPEALCTLLGVDAVVMTRIEKNRYLSDLASLGIDIAADVLANLGGIFGAALGYAPNDLNKTYDIIGDCGLYDGKDGTLLWKVSVRWEIDYNTKANEAIEYMNNKFARNFPYRNHVIR